MKKKILITGAAGFIGSNLIKLLLKKKDYIITGLDNLSYGSIFNINSFIKNPNFYFIKGNISNSKLLTKIGKDADIIVHLASKKIPRYSDAFETLIENTHNMRTILDLASKTGAKVIFSSTSDVYGKNPKLPFSENSKLVLGETGIKRWTYASTKIYSEQLCFAYQDEFKFPVTIIRYFGGYGPNQHLSWWGGPQSVFIKKALKNEALTIHGNGLQTRSFIYIEDLVKATAKIIETDSANGEIFNIGNNEEISIISLAKMIWNKIRNNKPKIEYISYKDFYGRYEDVSKRIPDLKKSQELLGFYPQTNLSEGLDKTIKWQKKIFYSGEINE